MSSTNFSQSIGNFIFITGGVRSGKSGLAEQLAKTSNLPVVYIATMQDRGSDPEVRKRILCHRQRRPLEWQTIEEPLAVAATLLELPDSPGFVIIDCLSLLISNLMLSQEQLENLIEQEKENLSKQIQATVDVLLKSIEASPHRKICLVSNEVGSGLYPLTAMGRIFCDNLGEANQRFAQAAQEVFLSCAGIPVRIK